MLFIYFAIKVQRLLPILNTCKAHLDDIEKCIKSTLDLLEPVKTCEGDGKPLTFCCILKSANNHSLSRDDIFKLVGSYFNSKNKLNKVEFDNPDYVLLIQIICNIAFISFVDNYFNYRKYNIVEMGAKFFNAPDSKTRENSSKSFLNSKLSAVSTDENKISASEDKKDTDSTNIGEKNNAE